MKILLRENWSLERNVQAIQGTCPPRQEAREMRGGHRSLLQYIWKSRRFRKSLVGVNGVGVFRTLRKQRDPVAGSTLNDSIQNYGAGRKAFHPIPSLSAA